MKKFKIFVVESGEETAKKYNIGGFTAAEAEAKNLLLQAVKRAPADDTYVVCDDGTYLGDQLVLVKNFYGEIEWRILVMGSYGPLRFRLLEKEEEKLLDTWRCEIERHVYELTNNELIELYQDIVIGSCYLSDYSNRFNIGEEEVSNYADGYEMYLSEEGCEDTAEEFAVYCSLA